MNSNVAKKVWSDMEQKMEIQSSFNMLNLKLNEWWISKIRSPCYKAILSLVANCVCLEFGLVEIKGDLRVNLNLPFIL